MIEENLDETYRRALAATMEIGRSIFEPDPEEFDHDCNGVRAFV